MNEIAIIILIFIAIVGTALIIETLINKNNSNEEYDIYIEEAKPSQIEQARQKVLERLINDQNTIKSLTIINTILTMALIIITIIEKIFTKTF